MKRARAALFGITGILYLAPLAFRALWDSDEGRYAEIAREMLELKDWITPHLNYVPHFEKPPLMYWLTAVSMAVFGQNAFAARIWCAVFALGTVFLIYLAGRLWHGERAGLLAGAITASALGFFVFSQFLVLDMALTFWITGILFAGMRLLKPEGAEHDVRTTALLGVCLAGGFLTKGPVAGLMTLPVLVLIAVWAKRASASFWKSILLGSAAGIIVAAPWFLAVSHRYPSFARFFFIHEHFTRYLTDVHHRNAPFYFFVPVILGGFLPWSAFLPAAGLRAGAEGLRGLRRDPTAALLLLWCLLIFLFFSASHSKLVTYALPLLPALSLLVAERFDASWNSPSPSWLTTGLSILLAVLCAILLFLKWPAPSSFLQGPGMQAFLEQAGPLYAALAFFIFAAVGVRSIRKTPEAFIALVAGQAAIFVGLAFTLPSLSLFHSTARLSALLNERAQPTEKVVVYGITYDNLAQTLPFYLGRRVAVYGDAGELGPGLEHSADTGEWYVPSEKATAALEHLALGTWIVTDRERWDAIEPSMGNLLVLVEKQGRLCLLQKVA